MKLNLFFFSCCSVLSQCTCPVKNVEGKKGNEFLPYNNQLEQVE